MWLRLYIYNGVDAAAVVLYIYNGVAAAAVRCKLQGATAVSIHKGRGVMMLGVMMLVWCARDLLEEDGAEAGVEAEETVGLWECVTRHE